MKGMRIAAAAIAASFLIGGTGIAVGEDSRRLARRGADDVSEGGHRKDHHTGEAVAPSDGKGNKGKALFEQKCGVCHELDRALSRTKTRDGWTATVKRMQQVNGCPITDAEAGEVIDYLSSVRGAK